MTILRHLLRILSQLLHFQNGSVLLGMQQVILPVILQISAVHVLNLKEPLLYWLKSQRIMILTPFQELEAIHIGTQLRMKNIVHYWQMIHGILFLYQRDENLLDANWFTEPSMDQMGKLINIKLVLLLRVFHNAEASPLLVGFTDSDWAGDPNDRKSTAGYVFTLDLGPITWACKKQGAISFSLAEAEYHDVVEASKEALWIRQVLSEFGFQQQHLTTLWCDNQSAIQLRKDPVQHQRSKHIELHMHFIRTLIHDHVLEVQYCSTNDQVKDIFTKALTEANFTKLRFMVGV
eukprot:PITA_02495